MPGDALDAATGDVVYQAKERMNGDWEGYIRSYAAAFEPLFAARADQYRQPDDGERLLEGVREVLEHKLEGLIDARPRRDAALLPPRRPARPDAARRLPAAHDRARRGHRRRGVLLGNRTVLGGGARARQQDHLGRLLADVPDATQPRARHLPHRGAGLPAARARGHEPLLRAAAGDREQPGADRRRGRRDALRARPLLPAPGRRSEPRLGRGGPLPHLPPPPVAVRPREQRRGEEATWAACNAVCLDED